MAEARSVQSPAYLRGIGLILGAALFITILFLPAPEGMGRDGMIVLALADAMQQNGVTQYVGSVLSQFDAMPLVAIILITCALLTFLTELTSNTATASILIPVMAATAVSIGQHPLLLMLPAALNASFAFMLPVATPPNAIVFSSSWISIRTMAKTGITLNLIGVILVTTMMYLLGMAVFSISVGSIPAWAL